MYKVFKESTVLGSLLVTSSTSPTFRNKTHGYLRSDPYQILNSIMMFVRRISLCTGKQVCGAFKENFKTVDDCNTIWEMFPECHRHCLLQAVSVWPDNKWLQSDIKNIQSMKENSTNSRTVHVESKREVPTLHVQS